MKIFYLSIILCFCIKADDFSEAFIWTQKMFSMARPSEHALITSYLEVAQEKSEKLLQAQQSFIEWHTFQQELEKNLVESRLQPKKLTAVDCRTAKAVALYQEWLMSFEAYKKAAIKYAECIDEYKENRKCSSSTIQLIEELRSLSRKKVLTSLSKEWPRINKYIKELVIEIGSWNNDLKKLSITHRSILEHIANFLVPTFSAFDEKYQLVYNKSTISIAAYKQIGMQFWQIIEETRSDFYQVYLKAWKSILNNG